MKDVAGKNLEIGQSVATTLKGYTDMLIIGKIVGFTEQKVKLEFTNNRWAAGVVLKFPEQLAIV